MPSRGLRTSSLKADRLVRDFRGVEGGLLRWSEDGAIERFDQIPQRAVFFLERLRERRALFIKIQRRSYWHVSLPLTY